MSAFQQSKQQQNALRGPIPSLYVQDTFHATQRLTIVAGVRWEPEYMPADYFNRGAVFNMARFSGQPVSTVYPNAPAGAFFYGDPGCSRSSPRTRRGSSHPTSALVRSRRQRQNGHPRGRRTGL